MATIMSAPLRPTPIAECWDCHGCGVCCRGSIIPLSEDDLAKLAGQRWKEHPDFAGVKTVVREGLLGGRKVLAKRSDGSCVFLTDDNRCRIHELHGADAKPDVCRMFPLQLVPLENFAYVTPRRSCPSAAADLGRPIAEQLPVLKKSELFGEGEKRSTRSPPIVSGVRRSWRDFLAAANALERLVCDERLPMVRRLIHALRLCALLEECRLRNIRNDEFGELIAILEPTATENAGEWFKDRLMPGGASASLFRQGASHYVRLHPGFQAANTWAERWRMMRTSFTFARGLGDVPAIHPQFPSATFADLDRPLGPLSPEVSRPLERFLEAHAASKQYAVVGHGRKSLTENFRALAMTFPMALYLLRWAIGQRAATPEDMVNIVVALERGRGMPALIRTANMLAQTQQLERLISWYSR
jgi:Fe-S-cluster containining protein